MTLGGTRYTVGPVLVQTVVDALVLWVVGLVIWGVAALAVLALLYAYSDSNREQRPTRR